MVRQTAMRLLLVHDLRAGDALQLAAALTAAEGQPEALGFVTLDDRLGRAAICEVPRRPASMTVRPVLAMQPKVA